MPKRASHLSTDVLFTELSDIDFRRFSVLVYEKCGINLHQRKKELVQARLGKRLREAGFKDFKAYYRFVTQEDSGGELVRMLDAISTNLTSFFREEKHFDFLRQVVLPDYAASKTENRLHKLRFWSAGCSSGEEAYSIAILLLEHFGEDRNPDIKILGTDISTKVLAQAKGGVYPAAKLEKIPTSLARKYFHRGYGSREGYFRVKPLLRDMVRFRRLNLVDPFPFEDAFDVILCRNVMIYFDERTQETLANKLYDVLLDGGYLFIGHSETLARISHRFKYIKPSVYQKL